jgi:protein O-GlcNAc transferase
MARSTVQEVFDQAARHHHADRLNDAEKLYRQVLAEQPNHADALHNLGVLSQQKGDHDAAVDLIRRAIALKPDFAEAYCNLGEALRRKGEVDEAIAACRRAIALNADLPEARVNLGNALKEKGRADEAAGAYREAIALRPKYAAAYFNLGIVLSGKGSLDAAIAAYRQAIAIGPNYAEAYYNLGTLLIKQGQLDDAITTLGQAISLEPSLSDAHKNLGNALADKGQLGDAIAAYRQAIAVNSNDASLGSNLVYALHFDAASNAQSLAEAHREWNRRYVEPLGKLLRPHSNDHDSERRLRVGYVSPDFREHGLGRLLIPLLAHHDKKQVEVFGYALRDPDPADQRLRSHTDEWRNLRGLSDAQAADLIREDQIDILVDLAMHTSGNRLLIFAHKPAPVQVTYLAYCSSTGLETIDYRLSDPYLDPPGLESFYSERTIRLPESYWCYQPIAAPVPGPLPAAARGEVTFGSLNSFHKVSEPALSLWAEILRSVPNSALLLSAHEGTHRRRVMEFMQRERIEPKRVRFTDKVPLLDYFRLYHGIDIALDTFPYAGGTTTCDALWMGVPTVTLRGTTAVGRGGVSILSNVGLTDWIAENPKHYVSIARQMSADLPRLSELRSTLRGRMQRSPLMDAAGFARNVEAAYRQIWRARCAVDRPNRRI